MPDATAIALMVVVSLTVMVPPVYIVLVSSGVEPSVV